MKTELENSILFRINHVANLLNSSFNHKLQDFEIAIEQRITLEFIKNMQSVSQTKIADVLVKDKTTISRTLRALETKGYIKRDEKVVDKRTNLIRLTDLGEKVLENSSKTVKSFRNKISSELTKDEKIQLFKLLEKVIKPIKEK
ncbi:MarR family transcriptional regulator [Halarcobacter sp.]|uniref:MarR family winged helix-turn-helix transcriptional regulator n=1 Tax=Halarcobacter sp. TaxID=2321133 RepID=UPI002AA5F621|nr:MarR family transcriptional regulator [Halarcobacter sp.]